MIVCFSGNGNTRFVADGLARLLDDIVTPLRAPLIDAPAPEIDAGDSCRVIWAFPVYAWGVPAKVRDFIKRVKISDSRAIHYMVATCGDDVGRTARQWRRLMRQRRFNAAGAWSVTMPNTYVSLPGFDVDTPDIVRRKLAEATRRIDEIATEIKNGFTGDSVTPGAMPEFKSSVLRPLFEKCLMSPRFFHTTPDCVGCGICARACPVGNIALTDRCRPQWSDNCTMCLACYHSCPHHAVAYGKMTRTKGQYRLPAQSDNTTKFTL